MLAYYLKRPFLKHAEKSINGVIGKSSGHIFRLEVSEYHSNHPRQLQEERLTNGVQKETEKIALGIASYVLGGSHLHGERLERQHAAILQR